jgi:hypothetical protein
MRNSDNRINRVVSRLAAEKKKTIIALCLIAVMAFMWVRVLGKKTPADAEASLLPKETADGRPNPQLKISFLELPKVKGRNDVLTRNFFAANSWRGFAGGGGNLTGIEEVGLSQDGNEVVVRRIAEKLKLDAILEGENPQAFINDTLLSVGDKLLIKDGVNAYKCEVSGIEKTKVFVRCGKAKITLKLTGNNI